MLAEVIAFQKNKIQNSDLGQTRNLLTDLQYTPGHALIISGMRRCGKSTLLSQFISAYLDEAHVYLNFDSARLYSFEVQDFPLLDEVLNENQSQWLIFDEIQIVDGWEMYARQKLDEGFKLVITGSNASLLSGDLGTKLTGRHIIKELFPFSFAEFCSFRKLSKDAEAFTRYLELGGFPAYLREENSDIHTALLDDIVYRDIAVRHNIRDVRSLKRLLVFLASNCSKLISANKLKQYMDVKSTATIVEYLNHFEESYLIQLVSKFSYSQKVQLVNPRKVYFIDNGLQQAITAGFSKDLGRRLENAVFWELRRQGHTMHYFNENGRECDFVVSRHDKVEQVIQVCQSIHAENVQREIQGLLGAMHFFKYETGTVITLDQEDVIYTDGKRIDVVPAYLFFQ